MSTTKSLLPFVEWYKNNKSYYEAKHGKENEDECRRDALRSYESIKITALRPILEPKKGKSKKEKPNPYGFN